MDIKSLSDAPDTTNYKNISIEVHEKHKIRNYATPEDHQKDSYSQHIIQDEYHALQNPKLRSSFISKNIFNVTANSRSNLQSNSNLPTGGSIQSRTTFLDSNKDLSQRYKTNQINDNNSRFAKNAAARKNTAFNAETYRLQKTYNSLQKEPAEEQEILKKRINNIKGNEIIGNLATIFEKGGIDSEVAKYLTPTEDQVRQSLFRHAKKFGKLSRVNKNYVSEKTLGQNSEIHLGKPAKDERNNSTNPNKNNSNRSLSSSQTSDYSLSQIQRSILNQTQSLSDVKSNKTKISATTGHKGRESHSFHSFTHENQSWEEHLLTNLSKSTAEWLVLEKSGNREDRQKMAKLMNFDDSKKDVQLVTDIIKCRELEQLTDQQNQRQKEKIRYKKFLKEQANLQDLSEKNELGQCLDNLSLAKVVALTETGNHISDFRNGMMDGHGNNYGSNQRGFNRTATYSAINLQNKTPDATTNNKNPYKTTSHQVKNFLTKNYDKKFNIEISTQNASMKVADKELDLCLEEQFPPTINLADKKEKIISTNGTFSGAKTQKKGYRKWIDDPKFHKVDQDICKLLENLFKNDEENTQNNNNANSNILTTNGKLSEPEAGPFSLIKEWARQSYFDVSWQNVTVRKIADLLLNIHEQDNLQGIIYILLAVTSRSVVDFPESLIKLVESKVMHSPRYKMVCKLLKILQDKTYLQATIDSLMPVLKIADSFFLSHFCLTLKNVEEYLDGNSYLLLIENVTKALFEPEKVILTNDKEKAAMTVSRLLTLLTNLCDPESEINFEAGNEMDYEEIMETGLRNASGIIDAAGENLQSVRAMERSLALDIISLAGKFYPQAANNCILERINYLLWNDTNLEVRQNAAKCLSEINAGHIVYDDLLDKFSNDFSSTNRLWCLSVIRKLGIITSKILPCYIACFDDKEHADVRLLASQIAYDLNLKSETVYHKLVFLAQTDTSNYVKASAIKSLTNYSPKDTKLVKLLVWAVTFENSPFVRLAAVNALEVLKPLKPLSLTQQQQTASDQDDQNDDQNRAITFDIIDGDFEIQAQSNFDAIKDLKERAIIEKDESVRFKIRNILKDQANIECKDSDLKELQMIKEQVSNLCTKDKIIKLLMADDGGK